MIYVSVYTNRVATEHGNAEYVKEFADDASAEAIAKVLFDHAEFEKAAPNMPGPDAILENLACTVELALKPPGLAVSINAERRLVVESVEPHRTTIANQQARIGFPAVPALRPLI